MPVLQEDLGEIFDFNSVQACGFRCDFRQVGARLCIAICYVLQARVDTSPQERVNLLMLSLTVALDLLSHCLVEFAIDHFLGLASHQYIPLDKHPESTLAFDIFLRSDKHSDDKSIKMAPSGQDHRLKLDTRRYWRYRSPLDFGIEIDPQIEHPQPTLPKSAVLLNAVVLKHRGQVYKLNLSQGVNTTIARLKETIQAQIPGILFGSSSSWRIYASWSPELTALPMLDPLSQHLSSSNTRLVLQRMLNFGTSSHLYLHNSTYESIPFAERKQQQNSGEWANYASEPMSYNGTSTIESPDRVPATDSTREPEPSPAYPLVRRGDAPSPDHARDIIRRDQSKSYFEQTAGLSHRYEGLPDDLFLQHHQKPKSLPTTPPGEYRPCCVYYDGERLLGDDRTEPASEKLSSAILAGNTNEGNVPTPNEAATTQSPPANTAPPTLPNYPNELHTYLNTDVPTAVQTSILHRRTGLATLTDADSDSHYGSSGGDGSPRVDRFQHGVGDARQRDPGESSERRPDSTTRAGEFSDDNQDGHANSDSESSDQSSSVSRGRRSER